MFQELAQNFISLKAGNENFKLRLYVGHDGSMVRLASGLGIQGPLRWPALGSEFIFEARRFLLLASYRLLISCHVLYASSHQWNSQVWKTHDKSLFVRVMHEGTPSVGLEWMSLDSFISLLQSNVPDNIFEQCMS
jgi:2-phosphoxylose phosphatase